MNHKDNRKDPLQVELRALRTNASQKDFKDLVKQLDDALAIIDGEEHAFYHQFNKIDNLKNVIVIFENDNAVACGAFKEFSEESVEIKRMFTSPLHRNKGLGSKVVSELEKWAKEQGYTNTILETGKRQEDAIALYTKLGYNITENYGQYAGIENSVCFKKVLT